MGGAGGKGCGGGQRGGKGGRGVVEGAKGGCKSSVSES